MIDGFKGTRSISGGTNGRLGYTCMLGVQVDGSEEFC